MSVSVSPIFNGVQFFDNDGLPLSGGKIFQYEAGSYSTEQTTYADNLGVTANLNPIVLDSSGRMTTDIWLTDGFAYNLVLKTADEGTILTGVDNVIGVVSSSSVAGSSDIWNLVANTPSYVSPTTFLLPGNVTTEFSVGNRVQIEYTTNSFKYGTVLSRTFSSPNTQVTLVNDSTVQNAGMTKVYWSDIVTNGRTGDAGAITYNVTGTYTTPATVGYALNQLAAADTTISTRIDSLQKVWTTTGGPTTFAITPSPALTSYTVGQIFNVKFNATSSGTPTINVNGLGAKTLYQYTSAGAKTAAAIVSGMTSQINYDGTDFILLDQLPAASVTAPRGQSIISTNSTFTVPANVYNIKVTAVGGGGGAGQGTTTTYGDIESGFTTIYTYGYPGGSGGTGIKYLATTPGATFSVTIGSGGAGTNTNGGAGGSTTFGASQVVATGGAGGTPSVAGAPGYGSVADYGLYDVGFQISTTKKGVGGTGGYGAGATGTAGAPGMVIVEW